jgi:hypothetical protein
LLAVAVLAYSFFSCSKQNTSEPVILDPVAYFPLDSGNYWIYQAIFITIDADVNTYDTLEVELKMTYSHFDDSLNAHILERFVRPDSTQNWSDYDVITISWTDLTMQWVEDNLRYVKLTNPVFNAKSWDGNSYNILNDWNYYYTDLNTKFENDTISYQSTFRVEKRDVKNVIQEQRAFEIFAENIGPVYEYYANFSLQSGDVNLGESKELILIKHGVE